MSSSSKRPWDSKLEERPHKFRAATIHSNRGNEVTAKKVVMAVKPSCSHKYPTGMGEQASDLRRSLPLPRANQMTKRYVSEQEGSQREPAARSFPHNNQGVSKVTPGVYTRQSCDVAASSVLRASPVLPYDADAELDVPSLTGFALFPCPECGSQLLEGTVICTDCRAVLEEIEIFQLPTLEPVPLSGHQTSSDERMWAQDFDATSDHIGAKASTISNDCANFAWKKVRTVEVKSERFIKTPQENNFDETNKEDIKRQKLILQEAHEHDYHRHNNRAIKLGYRARWCGSQKDGRWSSPIEERLRDDQEFLWQMVLRDKISESPELKDPLIQNMALRTAKEQGVLSIILNEFGLHGERCISKAHQFPFR